MSTFLNAYCCPVNMLNKFEMITNPGIRGPLAQVENISIERISEDTFRGMRDEWNSLLEKSVTNEFFLLWEWVYSWWQSFKDHSKVLFILIGRNLEGRLVGIAPLFIDRSKPGGFLEKNILRFCASVGACPDHIDFISDIEHADSFLKALFKYVKERGKQWDMIVLDGVKEDSIINNYLRQNGFLDLPVSRTADSDSLCPYLPLEKDFEGYLKSFSAKTRQTLMRKRRALFENKGSGAAYARFEIVKDALDLDGQIRQLFILHMERALRKGIKSNYEGSRRYNFHRGFIHSLFHTGKIVLAFLYRGSVPIASYYCIKHNGKYSYYQAGISVEGEKASAGTVLLSLLIEKAFEDGCSEFDFLRGSEEYKFFWTKKYRQNYLIEIRKGDLAGRLSHGAHMVFRKLLKVFASPE